MWQVEACVSDPKKLARCTPSLVTQDIPLHHEIDQRKETAKNFHHTNRTVLNSTRHPRASFSFLLLVALRVRGRALAFRYARPFLRILGPFLLQRKEDLLHFRGF